MSVASLIHDPDIYGLEWSARPEVLNNFHVKDPQTDTQTSGDRPPIDKILLQGPSSGKILVVRCD